MKKYSQKFSVEDRMRESKASREQIERRRQLMSDYEEWANQLLVRFRQEKSQRLKLRNGLSQCFLIFFSCIISLFLLILLIFCQMSTPTRSRTTPTTSKTKQLNSSKVLKTPSSTSSCHAHSPTTCDVTPSPSCDVAQVCLAPPLDKFAV